MNSELVLTFGKHKGKTIEDCPDEYLRWLEECCDWDEAARQAAEDERKWRVDNNVHVED